MKTSSTTGEKRHMDRLINISQLHCILLLLCLGIVFSLATVPPVAAQDLDFDEEFEESFDEDFDADDGDVQDDGAENDESFDMGDDAAENLDNIEFNEDDEDVEAANFSTEDPGGIFNAVDPDDLQLRSPEDIKANENAIRQEKELFAQDLYFKGRQAYLKGEYETAVTNFIQAQKKLEEASPTRYEVEQAQLDKILGFTYEEWADELGRQAMRYASNDDFDSAIKKLQLAVDKSPTRAEEIREKIKMLYQAQETAEIHIKTAPDAVDPGKVARDKDVEILLRQGQVFYDNGRFMDARLHFEQVLLKDIYNVTASKFLRRLHDRLEENSAHRFAIMKAERLAEVGWKWADPVAPLIQPDGIEINTTTVVKNVSDTDGIRKKLKEITIPKLLFEDATIRTVITHIKDVSKERDPENEGINIMILQQASAVGGHLRNITEDRPIDDNFGGEFEVEDFEDGNFELDLGEEFGTFEDPIAAEGPIGIETRTVTLDFDNIPLGEAIRYICRGANLKFRIEPYAVIIAAAGEEFDEMETRFYSVEAGVIRSKATRDTVGGFEDDDDDGGELFDIDPLEFFANKGVEFPTKAKIDYDARTSKLIVTNTPDNLRLIELILRELNRSPTQVTIESKFVEVAQTDINELGFEWLLLGEPTGSLTDPTAATTDLVLNKGRYGQVKIFKQGPGATESMSGGLRFANDQGLTTSNDNLLKFDSILGNIQYRTIIHALEQSASTDVLSAPKVTTLSGETAVIKMVQERFFPEDWTEPEFQAGSASGGTTTGASFTPAIPQFGEATEVGVIMIVTPTVAADGYSIDLDLEPEVVQFLQFDDYSYEVTVEGNTIDAILQMPVISRRKVQTKVIVWDGETVVLGGMITEHVTSIDDKIPFLGDVPLIGRLFRSDVARSEKRNLLIFVTARLVNPAGQPIRTQEIRGLPDFRR
jgi:general secretion pathway protein D